MLDQNLDRRTLVKHEVCDAQQPPSTERPLCPSWLLDGVDTMPYRSLNDVCPANPARVRTRLFFFFFFFFFLLLLLRLGLVGDERRAHVRSISIGPTCPLGRDKALLASSMSTTVVVNHMNHMKCGTIDVLQRSSV